MFFYGVRDKYMRRFVQLSAAMEAEVSPTSAPCPDCFGETNRGLELVARVGPGVLPFALARRGEPR